MLRTLTIETTGSTGESVVDSVHVAQESRAETVEPPARAESTEDTVAAAIGICRSAWTVEQLSSRLSSREWHVREAAAEALGWLQDPRGVEALCAALNDRDLRVRTATALALGQLADPRSVPALTTALRRSYRFGSAWGQVLFIAGSLAMVAGLVAMAVKGVLGTSDTAVLASLAIPATIAWVSERRRHSGLSLAIGGALARIAEAHPTPELRAALPDLRFIAADSLGQEAETRAQSDGLADRIEALTEETHRLPSPARADRPAVDSLPLPGRADAPPGQDSPL